jgi:hypothetical protein
VARGEQRRKAKDVVGWSETGTHACVRHARSALSVFITFRWLLALGKLCCGCLNVAKLTGVACLQMFPCPVTEIGSATGWRSCVGGGSTTSQKHKTTSAACVCFDGAKGMSFNVVGAVCIISVFRKRPWPPCSCRRARFLSWLLRWFACAPHFWIHARYIRG